MSNALDKFEMPDAMQDDPGEPGPPRGPVRGTLGRWAVAVRQWVVQRPVVVWAGLPGVVYLLALVYIHPPLYGHFIIGWKRALLFDVPLIALGVGAGRFGVTFGGRRFGHPHLGGLAAFVLWFLVGLTLSFALLIVIMGRTAP